MTIREAMEIVYAALVCDEDKFNEETHSACESGMTNDVLAMSKIRRSY